MPGEPINAARVERVVKALACDWHYCMETGSTNADVLSHHQLHQRDVVAFSESQSAGRGRRGREWQSPSFSNIYCTVGLAREIPAELQGLLSIVTGVALCRALRQCTAAAICLKWPNDLLFDGRKLGGILIESRPLADGRFFFAIGFGLNVFMPVVLLAAIPQPATSLAEVVSDPLDRTDVLIAAIEQVIESIRRFDPAGVPRLVDEFAELDAYHNQRVEVLAADRRIEGINRGINTTGQLRLETSEGEELHSAAEISLRARTA